MPGRVVMEQQHTLGSPDLKKDGSHAQIGETEKKQEAAQKSGQNGSISNGLPMLNGAPVQSVAPSSTTGLPHGLPTPPELDQSWRQSDANKSMGVLVERLAQQCMGDMNEALTKMADVAQPAAQANGIVPHAVDTSEASLSKKRTLLEFAHNQRDRFIKTLVLSDWARNADDMARLVDIKVWQEKQNAAQESARNFIGVMKSNLAGAKMPNPNIEGALELLATGKASRIPDLGYLPAKRLTAKQLLRTLQDMNVTLATRLNLHEELPHHFNDFSITNGRATFRVPQEFEVDLSVADEDPSTPFYFIDIRFSFSPTPSISNERLRGQLEMRANVALASDGLKGCYEFLHNFVLTHKINMLRNQAFDLSREKWFNCLVIDLKKRVLIIQYWSGMPGPKSWLEVGISTGKQKSKRAEHATPQHAIRWFRRGKEVANDEDAVRVDWQDLSAENILAAITAKHVSWLLTNIKDRMQVHAGTTSKLVSTLATSASTPDDCSLDLSLPGMRAPLTVRVADVTGKWSISPAMPLTVRAERALNLDHNADPATVLINLLCQLVQEIVAKAANLAGWTHIHRKSLVSMSPSVAALFGSGVMTRSIYSCSPGWGESWALIATFSLAGEKWWATRLKVQDPAIVPSLRMIAEAFKLSTNLFLSGNVSRAQLLRVEKLAAAEISMAVLKQELDEQDIRFKTERTTSLTTQPASAAEASTGASTAVVFDAAPLVKATPGTHLKNIQADVIRLTHIGVSMHPHDNGDDNGELAEMRHSLRLTVKPGSLKHLQTYLITKSRNSDVAMNASGSLALQLRTPFGQCYTQHIKSRLEACGRFDEYLAILRKYKLEPLSLSLEKFSFVYSNDPHLTATLHFAGSEGRFPTKLKMEPANSNPQQRVRTQAEGAFNRLSKTNPSGAFHNMIRILAVTIPAYQTFDQLELVQPVGSVAIHIHNPLAVNLEYRAPLPVCKFAIHLRNKDNSFSWNIGTPLMEQDGRGLPDPLRFALLRLCQEKGEGWFGDSRSRIVVESGFVGGVLRKIDGIMREFGTKTGDGASGEKGPDVKNEVSSGKPEQQQGHPIAKQESSTTASTSTSTSNSKQQQQKPTQNPRNNAQPSNPNPNPNQRNNGQQQPPQSSKQQQRPNPPARQPSSSNVLKKEIIELD
jgi:mediator of RNA polymerase II transcription subunit 14